MLDAVMHGNVNKVDRVLVVVPREDVGHIFGYEPAKGRCEVERSADRSAHLLVPNVPTVARKDACKLFESNQYKRQETAEHTVVRHRIQHRTRGP